MKLGKQLPGQETLEDGLNHDREQASCMDQEQEIVPEKLDGSLTVE